MKEPQVLALLKANQNARGIQNWNEQGAAASKLKSFGIGLTVLRKLAKQVGRDHALAAKLWKSKVYDMKVIALLIDDPKLMTREQAEMQVKQLYAGHLAHVFSSCDAALAKTPFVAPLADDWVRSKDAVRKRCGYGLLYELSKSRKKTAPEEAFFLGHIERISETFDGQVRLVQGAMGGALIGIGKRSVGLNKAALKLARALGPIQFYDDPKKCEPLDVVKHLTSDYLNEKFKR